MSEINQDVLDRIMSGQYKAEDKKQEEPVGASPVSFSDEQQPTPSTSMILKRDEELEQLPVNLLEDFPQPIPPYSDTSEEFKELLESIRSNGIIEPLLVRPYGDGYQIISGRNRKNAAKWLGYSTVPCVIRELSDDNAAISLVETIFRHRDMSKVPILQKAHAYRLWMDAMKRQGRRTDTSCQSGARLRSDEQIAESVSESARTIQRLIRITYLIEELQEIFNEGNNRLPLLAAVELSYLSTENQSIVHSFCFITHSFTISVENAKMLRQKDTDVFDDDILSKIWADSEGSQKETKPPKSLPMKRLITHIRVPPDSKIRVIEDYLITAVDFYETHKEEKSK